MSKDYKNKLPKCRKFIKGFKKKKSYCAYENNK